MNKKYTFIPGEGGGEGGKKKPVQATDDRGYPIPTREQFTNDPEFYGQAPSKQILQKYSSMQGNGTGQPVPDSQYGKLLNNLEYMKNNIWTESNVYRPENMHIAANYDEIRQQQAAGNVAKYGGSFAEGGEVDGSDSDFFNSLVDQMMMQQNSVPDEEDVQVQVEDEDSDYIKNLRSYDEDQSETNQYEELNTKISNLEAMLEDRISEMGMRSQEYDWFANEDGQEALMDTYNTQKGLPVTYTQNTSNNSPQGRNNEGVNPTSILNGIFKPEGAKVGQRTNIVDPVTGKRGSALGRGQMIKGTRLAMYKSMGITDVQAAEEKFRTDPNFETKVMEQLVKELDARIPSNIQGLERQRMIAKGWYTGNPFVKDSHYPGRGNKISAGQYADHAVGKLK